MENSKYILLTIVAIWIIISCSYGQTTYQKYDGVTRGVEYHIAKSQIESNRKMIEMLNHQKNNYSVLKKEESIIRSKIQGTISAKQSENFRLNQKAFMLMDANKIGDVDKYNASYNALKPTLKNNER